MQPLLSSPRLKQIVRDPAASGGVRLAELPEPALLPGTVLVSTRFSVISPGTERTMAASGLGGAVLALRERPELLRRVAGLARREGVRAAWDKVRARLQDVKPLGSSSSGIVREASPEAAGLRPGMRVACTGSGHAVHAEVACVPAMLCVPLPDRVSLEEGAFGTLGAIALHAVRVAAPQLGERVVVLGLGVIGRLIAQVLGAHGARVAAFDSKPDRVRAALGEGAEIAEALTGDAQVEAVLRWCGGADAVIVAAHSRDDAPMVAAARMARDRARIVATGLVPFALPREIAYAKELQLLISRSTGPGRHDPAYELSGSDYPAELVRWTVARNVEAFLHLVAARRVDLSRFVSEPLRLQEAPEALVSGADRILVAYPSSPSTRQARSVPMASSGPGDVGIAVIGTGAFSRGTLLPLLARTPGASLRWTLAATGLSASEAAKAHGAAHAGTDPDEAMADPAVKAVVIATRHDSHAALAVRALRAGKHVLVEKPLALDDAGAEAVAAAARESGRILLVGHNRRFAPLAQAARRELAGRGPVDVAIRVASPPLPKGHWLLDEEAGGGRLLGEGSHFLDLASFLAGDVPLVSLSCERGDGWAMQARFEDGSTAQALCTVLGDPSLPKERLEAHAGGTTVTIDDFREGSVARKRERRALDAPAGKGHAEELAAFVQAVRTGTEPVPLTITESLSRAMLRPPRTPAGA